MNVIKIVLSFLILSTTSQGFAETSITTTPTGSIIDYSLPISELSKSITKDVDGFHSLLIKDTNRQRQEGLPELPMLNILLMADTLKTGEDVEVSFSTKNVRFEGRVSYFNGEKCRCQKVEEVPFNSDV